MTSVPPDHRPPADPEAVFADLVRRKATYCVASDPAVGCAFWEAEDRAHFDAVFAPHAEYYTEVIEVTPMITPPEAMALLLRESAH